ncbi:MAG: hypothetical protein AAFV72_00180 [Cyanobacteria bacterium J06635_1]
MTNSLNFATLKFDPTEPRKSETHPDWAAQHSVKVIVLGASGQPEEHRIYFAEGELSALRKGDRVALEWRKGRWRMAKAQPTDLLTTLAQRNGHHPPSASVPAAVNPEKTAHSREGIEAYISGCARMMKYCLIEAEKILPQQATVEDRRSVATTLFIQAAKKFQL